MYKINLLTHLADDLRNYGAADIASAFPFENYPGLIKRMVRKHQSTTSDAIPEQYLSVNDGTGCSTPSTCFSGDHLEIASHQRWSP